MFYVFWYKIACLFTGLIIIFFGYNLFVKGIFNNDGEVEGSWNNFKLIIKRAAAGTYFIIFGSIIISMVVFKGLENEEYSGRTNHPTIQQTLDTSKKWDSLIIK